jgi:hypothetical protein
MATYKIHPLESKFISINQYSLPFNHVIIDNLFNQVSYKKLCDIFPEFIARTVPYKDQPGATSDYEGYISGLTLDDMKNEYGLFASKDLQNFVEKTFNIKTTQYISPSAHFHKAPSKSGFIHRDMNICSFVRNDTAEFVVPGGGLNYTDDFISDDPRAVKVIRSIALLYYLNNEDSIESTGGGTGIYDGYNGALVKTIEPKNNRLFIFEMCQNSYHAFIGANYNRSAIVSWFHSSPAYIINRHWKHFKSNPYFIERWHRNTDKTYWPIENDPEYSRYFNLSLSELAKF